MTVYHVVDGKLESGAVAYQGEETDQRDGWYVCTDHEDDDDPGPFYDEETALLADRLMYFADEAMSLSILSQSTPLQSSYLAVHAILWST